MFGWDFIPYTIGVYVLQHVKGVVKIVILCANERDFWQSFFLDFMNILFLPLTLNWDIPPRAAPRRSRGSAPHFRK